MTECIFSSVTRKDLKGVLYLGVRLGMVGSGDRKIVENSSLRDVFVVAGDATVLGGDSGLYGV